MARSKDTPSTEERAVPNVSWDDSQMTSTYANVCNVARRAKK